MLWARLARPKEKQKKRKSNSTADATKPTKSSDVCELSSTITNTSPFRFVGMPTIMGDFRRVARASASISLPSELIQKLVQSANEIPQNHNVEEQSIQHLHNFVQNHAASAKIEVCVIFPIMICLSWAPVWHWVYWHRNKSITVSNINRTTLKITLVASIQKTSTGLCHAWKCVTLSHLSPFGMEHLHTAYTQNKWLPLSENEDIFMRWASGQTNLPLVDAGMKELLMAGYTSNRVRQNLASVLTKDVKRKFPALKFLWIFKRKTVHGFLSSSNCHDLFFKSIGGLVRNISKYV